MTLLLDLHKVHTHLSNCIMKCSTGLYLIETFRGAYQPTRSDIEPLPSLDWPYGREKNTSVLSLKALDAIDMG